MNGKRVGIVMLLFWLASASAALAEQVEVVADSALVKVGDDVVTTVKQGERFTVLGRDGPWLAVVIPTPDGDREGWIFATRVQGVVEPGLDQESTAPGPFQVIRMDVGLTQFTSGKPIELFFELTLVNQGTETVSYDVSKLTLEVDDAKIAPSLNAAERSYWIYTAGSMNAHTPTARLQYLGAGTIAPGGTVSGWVSFEIPQIKNAGDPLPTRWILSGTVGGREVQLDLSRCEREALGAKVRPATIDPSIQVLEIGPRVNALNVDKLIDLQTALQAKRNPYIVVLTTGDCVVGELANRRLSSAPRRYQTQPVCAGFPQGLPYRLQLGYGRFDAKTEPAAAVQILGNRRSGGPQLIKYLADASPETRAATARALANHLSEQGVVDAVLEAAADRDSRVRSAVAGALAGADDPRATQALVRAMADPESTVRTSAARSAGSHPADAVAEPLLGLLDDSDWRVAVAAATSLGRLKSEPAVPRLQELAAGTNKPLAAAAIDALKAIGVLSELEAAIRKLDVAPLSQNEYEILAQTKEERVVNKLIATMQSNHMRYDVGPIARTLGQIGDPDAVDPLINQLLYSSQMTSEVPRALGELGDKRAIEPLQQSLTRASGSNDFRMAVQEALLMLDAPGILDQLAASLKEHKNQYDAQRILDVLGRAGDDRAVEIVAPYLDDAQLCRFAAGALLEINSDEALAEIKNRLHDEDYPHAAMVASRLIRMPPRPSGLRSEIDTPKADRVAALLVELGDSPHPAVGTYVKRHLAMLEQRIANEELREFRSLVMEKRLDDAAAAFNDIVRRRLDAVRDDPGKASRLTTYMGAMQQAYAQVGKREQADQLLSATITAIEAEADQTGYEELREVITDLRGQRLMNRINRGLAAEPDEMTQFLSDVKRKLARRAEFGLTTADLDLSMQMGRALERRDQTELAANVYRTVLDAIGPSGDEQLARITGVLEGTIRRLTLVGNPIQLSGTAVDGSPFDWEAYRGKVVLIDFWATWCGPCRREVPNVMKYYKLYHDRGFDVVGISLDRDKQALEQYLVSENLPWITLHDDESNGKHPVATHYGISSIPTMLLVDKEGRVISLRARGDALGRLLEEQLGPVSEDEAHAADEEIQVGPQAKE